MSGAATDGKKRTLTLLIVVITLAVIFGLMLAVVLQGSVSKTLLKINGMNVEIKEFEGLLNEESGMIKAKIIAENNIGRSGFDWYGTYGDVKPIEKLKEEGLKKIRQIKVLQGLAVENGLLESDGYSYFLKQLESENKQLAEAVRNGEPTYGRTQWQERDYYNYRQANLEAALSAKLQTGALGVSDAEAKQYYEDKRAESSDPSAFAAYEGSESVWRNQAYSEKFSAYLKEKVNSANVSFKNKYSSYKFNIL